MKIPVAALQMVSTPAIDENMATITRLITEAANQGARLVLLPEYWPIMGMTETDKIDYAETAGHGPLQDAMAQLAKRNGIWLVGGTIPLQATTRGKVMNTTLVFNPQGECAARYDKMHLFCFSKGNESYDEGRTLVPGNQPASVETPFGRIGLSICYDLRFPELYRALGDCTLLVVPAAFTYTTGQAHWEILLRARAIENQCYVLACGQGGLHSNGRHTWGHSMLIDPWGRIITQLEQGEGIVAGAIDLEYLAEVRASLPALHHRRLNN